MICQLSASRLAGQLSVELRAEEKRREKVQKRQSASASFVQCEQLSSSSLAPKSVPFALFGDLSLSERDSLRKHSVDSLGHLLIGLSSRTTG